MSKRRRLGLSAAEQAEAKACGRDQAQSLYLSALLQEKREPDPNADEVFADALIEEEAGQLDVAFEQLGIDVEDSWKYLPADMLARGLVEAKDLDRARAWQVAANAEARAESRRIFRRRQRELAAVRRALSAGLKQLGRVVGGLDKRDPVRERLAEVLDEAVGKLRHLSGDS